MQNKLYLAQDKTVLARWDLIRGLTKNYISLAFKALLTNFFLVVVSLPLYAKTPYATLLASQKEAVPLSQWHWTVLDQNAAWQLIADPSSDIQNLFPDIKSWSVLSSRSSPLMQNWIDQAFTVIFENPELNDIFCFLFSHGLSLSEFGGVTMIKSFQLMNTCKLSPALMKSLWRVQNFTKEYVFIFSVEAQPAQAKDALVPSSWTNMENTTFIVVRPETSFTDIVLSIIHEVAIQNDRKSQYLPTTHQVLTGISVNDEERKMMHLASINAINLTFATLRAFEIERLFIKNIRSAEAGFADQEKGSCEKDFRRLYPFIKKIAGRYRTNKNGLLTGESLYKDVADYAESYARENGLGDDEAVLSYLFKSEIRYDRGVFADDVMPFCEFMRIPHLEKAKLRTSASHGPRPPIVGGAFTDDSRADYEKIKTRIDGLNWGDGK